MEGHLVCVDCLLRFANTQIYGSGNLGVANKDTKLPAMDLKCFYSDCNLPFSREILIKALPRRTLEKYDEMQFQIAVQATELDNLVTCPKCSFQAELANANQKVFACPMEDCRFESCRR
jgi:TRIAD3 protein (E3 ubiquitin-protein ligase RNF216)